SPRRHTGKAGMQFSCLALRALDSGFRRNDGSHTALTKSSAAFRHPPRTALRSFRRNPDFGAPTSSYRRTTMKLSPLAFSAVAAAALAVSAIALPTVAKEMTVEVGGAAMYPSKNIIQNAVNSKDHTTLVAAVKAAGLVDTLQGPGPFTVFAPTND